MGAQAFNLLANRTPVITLVDVKTRLVAGHNVDAIADTVFLDLNGRAGREPTQYAGDGLKALAGPNSHVGALVHVHATCRRHEGIDQRIPMCSHAGREALDDELDAIAVDNESWQAVGFTKDQPHRIGAAGEMTAALDCSGHAGREP
jgi:hypothetical protein